MESSLFDVKTAKLPRQGNNSQVAFDFPDKYALNTNGSSYTSVDLVMLFVRLHHRLTLF